MNTNAWTLVSRRKGARFFRPVADVPAGLSWEASGAMGRQLAREIGDDTVQVWNVPTAGSAQHEEDRDNVLTDSGKRFPIRWDAAPQYRVTVADVAMPIVPVAAAVAARATVAGSDVVFPPAVGCVGPSAHARIAAAYAELPEYDGAAVPAFHAFAQESLRQRDALIAAGFRIVVQDSDPYANAAAMFADVARGVIRVLSTASTGGHPILTNEENDAFRAVHDVFGHAATGRGFDRHGEEAAYRSHVRMFSPLAGLAMATETRGQNAALIARGGSFDVQRVAILPAWALADDATDPTDAERPAAVLDAIRRHAEISA